MVAQQPSGHDVRALLSSQLGLITRAQALAGDETPASIKAKLNRGEWVAVAYGVYRATLFPASLEQRLLAQCLRSPGRVWASHGAAAWLHGLAISPPKVLSFTTTGQLKGGPHLIFHRTSRVAACDEAKVKGVPVTAIERTLIDLAAEGSAADLEFALDEALVTRRTSLKKIEWRLDRIGRQGRSGAAALGRCLETRRRLGEVDSHLEKRFLNLLRAAAVPLPELQYEIRLGERTIRADFAYPEHRLIIEVMGYRWHGGRDRWERDLLRSSELGAAGWRIIYVTKGQIINARRQTMNRIREALGYGPLFVL
ncbi:MAG: hypothetical protein KY391_02260 [Actinobacteria bacterium]|nr:hypothetical protein [Actinomycetota bacterium]